MTLSDSGCNFVLKGSPAPTYNFKQKTTVRFQCSTVDEELYSPVNRVCKVKFNPPWVNKQPINVQDMLNRVITNTCKFSCKGNNVENHRNQVIKQTMFTNFKPMYIDETLFGKANCEKICSPYCGGRIICHKPLSISAGNYKSTIIKKKTDKVENKRPFSAQGRTFNRSGSHRPWSAFSCRTNSSFLSTKIDKPPWKP